MSIGEFKFSLNILVILHSKTAYINPRTYGGGGGWVGVGLDDKTSAPDQGVSLQFFGDHTDVSNRPKSDFVLI